MHRPALLLLIALIVFGWCCRPHRDEHYAIRDFRSSLQPFLVKIVEKGMIVHEDSALVKFATDKELLQLTESEHPLLRAAAFRTILKRKSFDYFNVLMNHLDDTSLIETDHGEFGVWNRKVSDDILQEAEWTTEAEKSCTVEEVLTKHNYLRSAYNILE
jgi:hypothetical protein